VLCKVEGRAYVYVRRVLPRVCPREETSSLLAVMDLPELRRAFRTPLSSKPAFSDPRAPSGAYCISGFVKGMPI
jgi:hypothetical protein